MQQMNIQERKESSRQAFISLHLAVLLGGFTGLFGKLVTLNEVDIAWYRMFFAAMFLLVFTGLPKVSFRKLWRLAGTGALLGFHWVLFYASIKASNISIGVVCYSLVGFFTAIFEPVVFHHKISRLEILYSLITIAGLLCIFSFDSRYRYGIMIGVAAAAVAALYAVFNKKESADVRGRTSLLYQMTGGVVVLSAIIPIYLLIFPASQPVAVIPEGSNLWWLLALALFCTVGEYLLLIKSLRRLSAFTANITFNLEPVYSIIIAFLFFGEGRELNFSFYVGIALIVLSVSLQTLRSYKMAKHDN